MVKRRAPSPTREIGISIARPMASSRIDQSKGMIPPPPTPNVVTKLPTSPIVKKTTSPPPPVIQINETSYAAQSLESITSSSENLVKYAEPSSDANKAASSPPSLCPTRKVAEVTTIKRQTKTGWL